MNLKTVLTIDAIAGTLFGLGWIIIPAVLLESNGLSTDASTVHMARSAGFAVLALAIIAWMARNAQPSRAREGLALGLVVLFVLTAIHDTIETLSGTLSAAAWGTVGLTAILAVLTAIAGWSAMRSTN